MKQAWEDDAHKVAASTPNARGGSFARALLVAVPLSALLWGLLAWLL